MFIKEISLFKKNNQIIIIIIKDCTRAIINKYIYVNIFACMYVVRYTGPPQTKSLDKTYILLNTLSFQPLCASFSFITIHTHTHDYRTTTHTHARQQDNNTRTHTYLSIYTRGWR